MKIELHLHTKESSHCGQVPAQDALREYHRRGYGAVVITDHYSRREAGFWPYSHHRERVDGFLKGYRAAKELEQELGVVVLLGAELRFDESNENDYLVYGLDEEFFYSHPELEDLRFEDFLAILPETALLYQAHPFRNGNTVVDPKHLFGIEVFNGHSGHDSRNLIALSWARLHRLHAISGSDAHRPHILCSGGILADREVKSSADLVEVLREDAYALINKNVLDPEYWDGTQSS